MCALVLVIMPNINKNHCTAEKFFGTAAIIHRASVAKNRALTLTPPTPGGASIVERFFFESKQPLCSPLVVHSITQRKMNRNKCKPKKLYVLAQS